ncbi:MAG: DUF4258 domain-containing protein [Actinobacteria bacterium]|nr:DUF4258 domain-containing protein [Actinomycetota bacterium]
MRNDLIWTNHAKDRLSARKIHKDLVIQAIINPDKIVSKGDASEYQKRFSSQTVAAIIKTNEKGENIILSCWIDPPNPGTRDFRRKKRYYQMQKAGVLKKLWLTFLEQIGI